MDSCDEDTCSSASHPGTAYLCRPTLILLRMSWRRIDGSMLALAVATSSRGRIIRKVVKGSIVRSMSQVVALLQCLHWWILCCLFAKVIADAPRVRFGVDRGLRFAINVGRCRRGETRLSWQMFQGKIYGALYGFALVRRQL